MNLTRIDLNLLVVFDAVARTGSVKDAAPQLALSQPAVSHALNRLRELMDDPLFVRSHNRLVPTERALAMVAPVTDILDSVRAVMSAGQFDAISSKRTFRIAISDFTALTIVPWLIRKLRQVAPAVTVDLIPVGEQTLSMLESGELDCTFWGLRPPSAPYLSQLLFRDSFVAFCCKQHPLVRPGHKPITTEDYLAHPHAIAQFRDPNPSPVDVVLADAGHARTIALRSPSFMSNISAIAGTDLITTLPSRLSPLASAQGLRSFNLPFAVPDFPYSLVWHRRTEPDPACIWFRHLMTGPALLT
ncbi:LysR family transcriptional regulator [Niveispirillum sp.]|uniref:LysR family transcriptional regulator n=1 Tax=Niveispirillum sp. TaxID=1917217 RepID=UPI001B67CDDF|nr:LysR family transcriptional regulator [Niveispirillum sp.]MBP7336180.1 LysR family transcriptional regulator [Niveispirillum sp.]